MTSDSLISNDVRRQRNEYIPSPDLYRPADSLSHAVSRGIQQSLSMRAYMPVSDHVSLEVIRYFNYLVSHTRQELRADRELGALATDYCLTLSTILKCINAQDPNLSNNK